MSMTFEKIFDDLVVRYYGLIAIQIGLTLTRLADGIYEIAGKSFAMRMRRGTGHFPSFLITVSERKVVSRDLSDPTGEIGLGVIANFNNVSMPKGEARLADLEPIFAETAKVAERFGVPYILGEKTDLSEIREFIEKRIQEKGIREKKYHLPKNVRQEWI